MSRILIAILSLAAATAQAADGTDILERWKRESEARKAAHEARRASATPTRARCLAGGEMNPARAVARAWIEEYQAWVGDGPAIGERVHAEVVPAPADLGQMGAVAFYVQAPDGSVSGLVNQGGVAVFGAAAPGRTAPFWYRGPLTPQRVSVDLGLRDPALGNAPAICRGQEGGTFQVFAGYGRLTPEAVKRIELRQKALETDLRDLPALPDEGDPTLRQRIMEARARASERLARSKSGHTVETMENHEMYRDALQTGTCWHVMTYTCPSVPTGTP